MDDFELSWRSNKERFPAEFNKQLEQYYEIKHFFYGKLMPFQNALAPLLKELMYKQNPQFSVFTHPSVFKFMDTVNEANASGLMWQTRGLLKDFKAGVIPEEKYDKLDEWREFYASPPQPSKTEEEDRKYYPEMNDEQWLEHKEKEDRAFLTFHNYEEKRKTEYYDIVQSLLFKTEPELETIEGDYWILYAVEIRDNYEEWKTLCEQLETIIDYDLPQESVELSDKEFNDLLSKNRDRFKSAFEKRNKRINSY